MDVFDRFKAWNSVLIKSKWLILILAKHFIGNDDSLYEWNTWKKEKNPENQTLQKDLAVSEHNQKVSSSREMYLNIPEKYVV